MPISIQCSSCDKKLKVKDELAGKRVQCPACKRAIVVPDEQAGRQAGTVQRADTGVTPSSDPFDFYASTPASHQVAQQVQLAMIQCRACNKPIAANAATCPTCGAPNDWLHPEIQRFKLSLQSMNFLPAESSVDCKAYRVWGVGSKKDPEFNQHPTIWGSALMIASILMGCLGAVFSNVVLLGIAPILFFFGLVGLAFGTMSGGVPDPVQMPTFSLDFGYDPPKWSCNDEHYWAEVRRFFNV